VSLYLVTLTAHTTDGIQSATTDRAVPLVEALDTAAGMAAGAGEPNVIEIKIERSPRHA
jgi:hypothetical protein